MDPLSQAAGGMAKLTLPDPLARTGTAKERSPFLSWPERKAEVLREFTVSGNISLASGLMDADDNAGEEQSVPLAKARQRLQALESAARGVATVEMSQSDIIRRVEKMQRDLQRSWENNQRVTSLKICIQASKLLTQAQVPQFYPSLWTMVTEVRTHRTHPPTTGPHDMTHCPAASRHVWASCIWASQNDGR